MKLAIEHLQRSIRETEAKIEHATRAYDSEKRVADARGEEIESLKALLSDLRAVQVRLQGPQLEAVPEPSKKKRA